MTTFLSALTRCYCRDLRYLIGEKCPALWLIKRHFMRHKPDCGYPVNHYHAH